MLRTPMPSQDTTQLFAVLSDDQRTVRRLPVAQALQSVVRSVFQTQAAEFTGPSIELLDFDPSLRPDEAHIIRIPQFVLPAPIRAAMENPLGVEPLGVTSETLGQIAGL